MVISNGDPYSRGNKEYDYGFGKAPAPVKSGFGFGPVPKSAASTTLSPFASSIPAGWSGTGDPFGRNPDGATWQGFGRGYTQEQMNTEATRVANNQFEAWMKQFMERMGGYGGGGGGSGSQFDYSGALAGLMNSNIFNPTAVPTLQQYSAPAMYNPSPMPTAQQWTPSMVDPTQLQQWNPTMVDPSQLQQWTPTMLAAPDFTQQYSNIDAMGQTVRDQIGQAWDPALAALAQQNPTSIGAVQGTATQLSPELSQLAGAMGVDGGYAADLAAANQGIQGNADLFSGRNAMLDRVFANNQQNTYNIAQQAKAGALSGAGVEEMLARAGLDRIAQQAKMANDQYNNGLLNQAGQYNSGMLNDAYMTNVGLGNQAGQYNTGLANDAYLSNVGMQNQAGQYNTGVNNEWNLAGWNAQNAANEANTAAVNSWLNANTDIANEQSMLGYNGQQTADANRLAAILELITSAANNGQPIDPSLYAALGVNV